MDAHALPTNGPRPICNIPVSTVDTEGHTLDISATATPCHIRLVDCKALTEQRTLRIVEFPEFPAVSYAAISYPWRGVAVDEHWTAHTFSVRGAEHADPVGADALRHACAAVLLRGCPYLWLDRLCIIQNSKEDKHWQIRHMYRVYKSCRVCIVLAGGVRRLVRLDEETSWIHRSWTLQEVLAPPAVVVLLDWKLGSGSSLSGDNSPTSISSTASPWSPKPLMVEASIFSSHPSNHSYNDIPLWRPQRKLLAPNVSALTIAMDPVLSSDPDARAHAVWQSALMRTSSRPVDMVFSIMGLFGVTLDPSRFDQDDRRGATIALAQEILKAGRSASWLGVGVRLEPDRTLSTFAAFPRTSVSGVALVQTKTKGRVQEVSELMDPVYPVGEALVPFPKGSMDDAGYFSFTAKAVRLRPAQAGATPNADGRVLEALDGSRWLVHEDGDRCDAETVQTAPEDRSPAYAVLLGWFNKYYPGMTSAHDTDNIRAMLVEAHRPDAFNLRSFITLHRKERGYVLGWPERAFRVGGPDLPSSTLEGALTSKGLVQPYSERDLPWPRIPNSKPIVTIEDEVIRKARWAVPQRVLERHGK
ncbi:hypothetical protein C8Q74DRAFT_1371705 [Fomes fomentarius]|nr:hypothetical protein C8Q74DRAFT_1371705 [Fomes fomentarius]